MKNKFILPKTLISLSMAIMAILVCGCNFMNSDNKSNEPVYKPEFVIPASEIKITQQADYYWSKSVPGKIEERAFIKIAYPLTWTNVTMVQIAETTKNVVYKLDYPKYGGMTITAPYNQRYNFTFTPTSGNTYGRTVSIEYTTDPAKNLEPSSGEKLPDATQEIDCSMVSGDYRVFDLEKSTVKLTNSKDTSVYVVRANATTEKVLESNRFALPGSTNNFKSIRSAIMSRESFLQENSADSKESGAFYFGGDAFLDEDVSNGVSENISEEDFDLFEVETESGVELIRRINPKIEINPNSVVFPSRNARAVDPEPSYPIAFNIDDKKTVYAGMINQDIDNCMAETTATLQYKSDKCQVWAVERYFVPQGESQGAQVNKETCEKIGKTLDEVLELERNIFGNEKEELRTGGGWVPMETNSETGTIVNILLYDIAGDYVEGGSSGIYGFFTSGDYFLKGTRYNSSEATGPRSNGGKYLHLDSGFAANEKTLPVIISTVVHEFQHMINFGQKKGYEGKSSTLLNEMCSLLAEDMFQEKLQLADMDSAKHRFMHLTFSWRYLPIFTWDSDRSNYSYSNGFGIGSFLSKKYGGADFVYDFMHTPTNQHCTVESLMEAVRMHDSEATMESVLRDFCVELCTCKTFNSDVYSEKHIMNDYKYPMTKFDFKNYNFISGGAYYTGPQYTTLSGNIVTFEPYKIDVSKVEDVASDSEEIYFFGKSDPLLKEYIVVVRN